MGEYAQFSLGMGAGVAADFRVAVSDQHMRGEGHAAYFDDHGWHVGYDLDDERAVTSTGADLFACVGNVSAIVEELAQLEQPRTQR